MRLAVSPGRAGAGALACCVALCLVAGGCGSGKSSAKAAAGSSTSSSTTPVTTAPPSSCPAPVPGSTTVPPDLGTVLLAHVPGDYLPQDEAATMTGPTGIDAFAAEDGRPDAKQALEQAGYQGGYEREWAESAPENRVLVGLYRFASTQGATTYLARLEAQDAGPAPDGSTPVPFPVPDVPGGAGWATNGQGGAGATIAYSHCGYVVSVEVDGHTVDVDTGVAQTVAAQQLARL